MLHYSVSRAPRRVDTSGSKIARQTPKHDSQPIALLVFTAFQTTAINTTNRVPVITNARHESRGTRCTSRTSHAALQADQTHAARGSDGILYKHSEKIHTGR